MALTESSLLSNFLVSPAPLAVSLSLQQFTELFPKSRQGDATIPALYHELQKQRTQDIERVKQNIAAETKRGMSQQRHIGRIRQARLRQELWDDAAELTIEAKVCHPTLYLLLGPTDSSSSFPSMQMRSSARPTL
jgi:centromere-localized protein 2